VDVSSPQTPVLFASNTIEVTKDIIDLYDKNSAAPAATAAPSTPRPPATPTGSK
jgi:outer membrane protein